MESWREGGALYVRPTEAEIAAPVELHATFEDFIFLQAERRIFVDLSEVRMLTSLMIGALVSLHLLAYENVVVLTFENVDPKIRNLFELIGLDQLMESHYGPAGSTTLPGRRGKGVTQEAPEAEE